MKRKLAAILVADVVGFSRHMGEDEIGTLKMHRALRHDIIDPTIEIHQGGIVNPTGDGVLVAFESVVDAVTCAVQIQTEIARRHNKEVYPRQLSLRIGINLGDVIVDGNDFQGDGVNIAVRIEGLADPGGICVTQPIYTEARDKLPYSFEDLGEKSVKNIVRPQRVYRVVMHDNVLPNPKGDSNSTNPSTSLLEESSGPRLIDKPSIAVLPFANLAKDPTQEIFADGITHDVITDLAKFSGLFVVAANSTFRYKGQTIEPQDICRELGVRYLLEGSVQRDNLRLRVNVQLIDAANGQHVWAERWERDAADLLSVQSEIAKHIVMVIGPISDGLGKLLASELRRLEHMATENLDAYGHFLTAMMIWRSGTIESATQARVAFDRAITLDPTYAKAIARKAWTYVSDYWEGHTEDPDQALETAEALAVKAATLDPAEPEAHRSLGAVQLFLNQHDLAIRSFESAIAFNPNGADALMWLGWALVCAGEQEKGLTKIEQAMVRNPFPPGWYYWDLAWAHFNTHRYDAAIDALIKTSPKAGGFYHLLHAASCINAGRSDRALKSMRIFRETEPNYTIETAARANPFKKPEDLEHYLDALRAAGLPEIVRTNQSIDQPTTATVHKIPHRDR